MLVVRQEIKVLLQAFIVVAFTLLCSTAFAQSAGIRIVRSSVHHDVSPPLRDLIGVNNALAPASQEQEAESLRLIPLPSGLKASTDPDPALQQVTSAPESALAPTAGLAFDGLGSGFPGFAVQFAPPDTN